jgi:hypothetical protein
LADGPAGFRRGSSCPAVLRIRPGIRRFSVTGLLPSLMGLSRPLRLTCFCHIDVLQPQGASPLVWASPLSLAATDGITVVFFSSGYLDVSVPRVCLLMHYGFMHGYMSITSCGFPHSDILGSRLAYSSPRHFVVRHVLLRLLAPRHPPCALDSLSTCFCF